MARRSDYQWSRNSSVEARELAIFIDNDGQLYRQMVVPIQKNLVTKMARGTYDSEKAHKAFYNLAVEGAKRYTNTHGGRGAVWHEMFSVADRKAAAAELLAGFEEEAELGNYDDLLPKKYRRNAGGSDMVPHPNVNWWDREDLERYLVWRGFAVYARETDDELRNAVREDLPQAEADGWI